MHQTDLLRHLSDTSVFDLAPVSLWLEDLSELRCLLDRWTQDGMRSVKEHLFDRPDRLEMIQAAIRVIKVNRKTLLLYDATDADELLDRFQSVMTADTLAAMVDQVQELWSGETEFFSKTVNYTLSGRRLDIQLRGNLLPGYENCWSRVLVAVEDVTDLQRAQRQFARNEAYARGLFEHSPVALCVKNYSGVKRLLDHIREEGVDDLRAVFAAYPEFLHRCMDAITVLDVNIRLLQLYGLPENATLHDCLLVDQGASVQEQLIGLWNGALFQEWETTDIRLNGETVHLHIQFSVLPGHEADWSLVQVARTDITARKQAEARIDHLHNHDSLTGLHSRAYYNRLLELYAETPPVLTVLAADLNGLKPVNDRGGHAAGDALLARAGRILAEVTQPPWSAARIGGDEFIVLMPNADEQQGQALRARIVALVEAENTSLSGCPLSLSIGVATRMAGESLTDTVARADNAMYESKRDHYEGRRRDRRARLAGRFGQLQKPQADRLI